MVGGFVLDASVAIAWCFEDEATPASQDLLQAVHDGSIVVVPPLWHWEVSNAVLTAVRRARIDVAAADRFLHLLRSLSVRTDSAAAAEASGSTWRLAREQGLTVYDAAYLETARRLGLPLATRDEVLGRAASAAGVARLPA